ncbi:acetyl-CoA carboxylase biotin carboxyl carrier protein [Candidatus Odyssella thessalonicensis]|uniref:acetyl-CoA carboxylase biotin carboxyl carrier protein n=1 Tax=Candidatus Odyssella thessalonicensis TaxID=84647 RepID=UPI000225C161|nr:acetyl-CoA carboxylase biotin carboxyl carrier protein [Candidatus Odyssella thessalonicensis]
MTDKLSIEKDAIRALADILVETDLTEIEYENEGHRIRVARNLSVSSNITFPTAASMGAGSANPSGAAVYAAPAAVHPNPPSAAGPEGALKSPMVGTVYTSPEPGAASFVKVGDSVSQGQTLLIIEAMKVMNPIKAPRAGKITSILITDAQPVEFGEPLLVIE